MNTSKIFTGVLLLFFVFALNACGNRQADNQSAGDAQTPADAQTEAEQTAQEETVEASATLSPDQETAEVTSDGSGSFKGTYNKTTGELSFELEWSDLTGPPTMMHFHGPADRGADAGVKIGINDFPAQASGSVSQTVTVGEADRADFLAGKWYVNIHTEKYGPGEIRGQVEFKQ